MRLLICSLLCAAMFTVVGCKSEDATMKSDQPKMMSDACSHCAGTQKAKADGTCPQCKMPVSGATMGAADACSKCPGVQTANANGKCPMCAA